MRTDPSPRPKRPLTCANVKLRASMISIPPTGRRTPLSRKYMLRALLPLIKAPSISGLLEKLTMAVLDSSGGA